MLNLKKNKKGIELEMLGKLIIAVVILVLLIIGVVILRGKGINALEFIKDLFKLGG
jgi:hypothetical protein